MSIKRKQLKDNAIPYFKIGKYYRHTGGRVMHIVSAAKTTMYGWCLIAEQHGASNLVPVGSCNDAVVGWKEITADEWMQGFSSE